MSIIRSTGRLGAGLLAMALLAACASGGATPSAAPTQPPADAPVTAPPSDGTGVNNKIVVTVTWTSGVEPCTILDSIVATKGDGTYTVTLNEGSNPQEIACIAIAEQHVTEFEIPDVAAGTWRIIDSGGVAPPVDVTVG
jgi:hypothetical protein